MLNVAWLKWTVLPLLAFLLTGLVTRNLVPARRSVDRQHVQQTIAASMKQLDSGDRAGALDGLVRAGAAAGANDMAAQTALIVRFRAMGEHKLAAEAIERALRAAPQARQTVERYAGLCRYLLDHGDIGGAQRILAGDLMARWPDAMETGYLQGRVALEGATGKEDVAAAAKQLQRCVALDPDHVPSKLQLGIAYSRLGALEQAEPLLRAVLEKQPVDPVALSQLGEVLRQQGKAGEAARVLEEHTRVTALQARRQNLESQALLKRLEPADLLELGRVYMQLGEWAPAARTLRSYVRRQPEDAGAQRELARVCLKIDDEEGARQATEAADALEAGRHLSNRPVRGDPLNITPPGG